MALTTDMYIYISAYVMDDKYYENVSKVFKYIFYLYCVFKIMSLHVVSLTSLLKDNRRKKLRNETKRNKIELSVRQI